MFLYVTQYTWTLSIPRSRAQEKTVRGNSCGNWEPWWDLSWQSDDARKTLHIPEPVQDRVLHWPTCSLVCPGLQCKTISNTPGSSHNTEKAKTIQPPCGSNASGVSVWADGRSSLWIIKCMEWTQPFIASLKSLQNLKRGFVCFVLFPITTLVNEYITLLFFFFFFFFGPHLWHMEGPRLGVESELQLPAYTHSHSNARCKLCLRPITQLTETPDA